MQEVSGIDFKIDKSIQDVCLTASGSATVTRAVFYVAVILGVFGLVIILNTNTISWKRERLKNASANYLSALYENEAIASATVDSLKLEKLVEKELKKQDLIAIVNDYTNNVRTVSLPFVSATVDVNDFGVLSGFSFLVLLAILSFTVSRELNNLKLALNAVTARYTDDADNHLFRKQLEELGKDPSDEMIARINTRRRVYHYNFLSMNEIFTSPRLSIEKPEDRSRSRDMIKRLLGGIYWIPVIIYTLTIANDLLTFDEGHKLSFNRTTISMVLETAFLIALVVLAFYCKRRKSEIQDTYDKFRERNYQFKFD